MNKSIKITIIVTIACCSLLTNVQAIDEEVQPKNDLIIQKISDIVTTTGDFLTNIKENQVIPNEPQTQTEEQEPPKEIAEKPIIKPQPQVIEPKLDANDSWQLLLVNKKNPLSKWFSVNLVNVSGGYKVDKRIAGQVEKMLKDSRKAGINLKICSAYRAVDHQERLYTRKVKSYQKAGFSRATAEVKASTIVAPPKTSEHHTGLALDIITQNYTELDNGFDKTKAYSWMSKNAQNYGFILRYPKDKQNITGIIYEPWHYRYVGIENAKEMKKSNLVLEEYITKKFK